MKMLERLLPNPVSVVKHDDDDDIPHIACECRPMVNYCGRMNDEPLQGYLLEGAPVCPECDKIGYTTGCPICGCRHYNLCDPCLYAED